jgi:multicomponent Na+:H+ antiporter subunit D
MVSGALATEAWVPLAVIVASTLLNAGYFLPIVYRAFFGPDADGAAHGEAPWPMVAALVCTAALTVLMFFWAELPLSLARRLL